MNRKNADRKHANLKKSAKRGKSALTRGKPTLQAEEIANAAVGAAVGAVVAGPAGAVLGGLAGVMIDTRSVSQGKTSSATTPGQKGKETGKGHKHKIRRPQKPGARKRQSGAKTRRPGTGRQNARKREE